MGNKQYIQEDRSKIKSINFKYPNIMSPNAEEEIRKKHLEIIRLKSEIAEQSMKLTTLQDQLAKLQKEFHTISELFDIEYETVIKEYTINNVSVMIQNHGNSIIGKTSKL